MTQRTYADVLRAGRGESIVTFRNTRTGAIVSLVCVGDSADEQVANGLRAIADREWKVVSRSTPKTILYDVRGRSAA